MSRASVAAVAVCSSTAVAFPGPGGRAKIVTPSGTTPAHEVATVDIARLAGGRGPTKIVAKIEPRYGPESVWTDHNGHIRRFDLSYSDSVPGSGSVRMTTTMDLYDLGVPVHAIRPVTTQVYDATDRFASTAAALEG